MEWCWGAGVLLCHVWGVGVGGGGVSERREALRNRSNSQLLSEVTLRSGEIGALCVSGRVSGGPVGVVGVWGALWHQ